MYLFEALLNTTSINNKIPSHFSSDKKPASQQLSYTIKQNQSNTTLNGKIPT